jgi:predicted ester cyclase
VDERNLVSLLRLIENGFNGDRLDLLDDVLAPDLVCHVPLPVDPGREGLKAAMASLRAAFPGSTVAIDDLAFGGDAIYRRWSFAGVHGGDFQGMPPTGRSVRLSGVDVDRFEGGMVVEHWSFWNPAELLGQLGIEGP